MVAMTSQVYTDNLNAGRPVVQGQLLEGNERLFLNLGLCLDQLRDEYTERSTPSGKKNNFFAIWLSF